MVLFAATGKASQRNQKRHEFRKNHRKPNAIQVKNHRQQHNRHNLEYQRPHKRYHRGNQAVIQGGKHRTAEDVETAEQEG